MSPLSKLQTIIETTKDCEENQVMVSMEDLLSFVEQCYLTSAVTLYYTIRLSLLSALSHRFFRRRSQCLEVFGHQRKKTSERPPSKPLYEFRGKETSTTKSGGHYPINLKHLNKLSLYQHFKMEGLNSLKNTLLKRNYMCKLDLKDAYFTVPLHIDSRQLV